ncbi:MAG: phospho-N-acetylmuramoyl-pentapeptide-transferase [Desulfobacteraceae bacterium]
MLYHLLYSLHTDISAFNIFRYITFRTICAMVTAFLICFISGPWLIRALQKMQIGQYIRKEGPQSHYDKAGTPTMGGVMIMGSILLTTLAWANLNNRYVWITILAIVGFTFVGFTDDYLMQVKKRSKGLGPKAKLLMQIGFAVLVGWLTYTTPGFTGKITIPFVKSLAPDLGMFYIAFAAFVIVGTSNAVNLTDGLDGLAIGPIIVSSVTYMLFAYVAGHFKIAQYLQLTHVPGSGEISIICGAMAGAGVGFLWFNAYPAQVFMGDTGSLPLGGVLGTIAVITKQEILLVIVGGLFVIEALSVILQVGYFKITNGQRIFRMAPLHHHFELKGWPEPKVIVRFWIISIILALAAVSTLKIR